MASKFALSWPPIVCLNSLDHDLGVHRCLHMISASKCISNYTRLEPPSSHDDGLKVHLQTRSITACEYIFKELRRVYGNTAETDVHRVTGSKCSADPRVDRHYPISISSYHTMKIHTVSFPPSGLTCSVRNVDHQRQVVSYLLTQIPHSLNKKRSFSWIPFGCCARCGRVLMVVSLPSSSIVSPQWPLSGASLSSLNGRVQVLLRLCSTTICSQIDRMYTYTEAWIMHPILWCSESCESNNDEYDKTKYLMGVRCAKVSRRSAQRSQEL